MNTQAERVCFGLWIKSGRLHFGGKLAVGNTIVGHAVSAVMKQRQIHVPYLLSPFASV